MSMLYFLLTHGPEGSGAFYLGKDLSVDAIELKICELQTCAGYAVELKQQPGARMAMKTVSFAFAATGVAGTCLFFGVLASLAGQFIELQTMTVKTSSICREVAKSLMLDSARGEFFQLLASTTNLILEGLSEQNLRELRIGKRTPDNHLRGG
ncbi:MAG: hypothetical protein VKK04_16850 [Synechococcales bacterium]|nr:hypothetical protein [Synechococcales bacterium]